MGEAKRRKELGIDIRGKGNTNKSAASTFGINNFISKYPFFPYILGLSMLFLLIFDLINYYK